MLLVPPNSHPHSSHTPSLVEPSHSNSSSPGQPSPPSPPQVKSSPSHTSDHPATNPPHMSGLSDAHYPPPVPVSTASSASQPVSGRSPQAPPAPLSAPGTPAPTTPTPAPPTTGSQTRPSSGGSASGGPAPPVTSSSSSLVSVAGGLGSAAGGPITTVSLGTGGGSGAGAGGLPQAMPVPGPSATPSGGSSGQGQPLQHHPLLGYVPHGANKILSRNINGTHIRGGSDVITSSHHGPHHPPPYSGGGGTGGGVGGGGGGGGGPQPPQPASGYHSRSKQSPVPLAVTSQPSNESELQLYRVLQRANLLNYYDTFISQGGDDVQQLCEAGEEEFLEIMALVGMASKPLHVRRLQKALQEWVSNPGLFLMPLSTPPAPAPAPAPPPASGMPPQLDVFNVLSSLSTYRQHHQPHQSSNSSTQSPRARGPPPSVGAIAATAPHTAPYQRPQPYPSPENLAARKSPPTGGVAPQPGSVSPTDYRRVLEAAWALRAAGQQDPRSSPPGGKVSPPWGVVGRPTRPSTTSPPSTSNHHNHHHTDTLHNSTEGQPFLPGTPVPWFPFLVPVNKL